MKLQENQLFLGINKYNTLICQVISFLLIAFGTITIFAWQHKTPINYSLILICFLLMLILLVLRLIYTFMYFSEHKVLFISDISFTVIFFGLLISYFVISSFFAWSGFYILIASLFSFIYLAITYSIFKSFYLNQEEGLDNNDEA